MESAAEACRLEPHHWMNHVNLAQAALGAAGHGGPGAAGHEGPGGQASLAAARHASETARELAPNEPSVHYLSGQVSRAYGDKDGARLHFERTLSLDPEHSSAINELGRRGWSAVSPLPPLSISSRRRESLPARVCTGTTWT